MNYYYYYYHHYYYVVSKVLCSRDVCSTPALIPLSSKLLTWSSISAFQGKITITMLLSCFRSTCSPTRKEEVLKKMTSRNPLEEV